ncbi:signal peptidase I [uncultured Microbacterium sp.]|uniref:signal peptidase I n=1 Tax=uncultured Microbacterium sp. TaxID=191216 RepID=UPI002621B494|nr:signal peptidase I [uncultured Microbacterium sp.]
MTTLQRIGRIAREALLTLLALGGVCCIVLVILAFTGGYSLIMFKTGSMSPTIPAGSVALVQEIPASDIAVGDVVTVDRDGALPVTHRVTSIADDTDGAARTFTMRGDANEIEDPLPYTATEVRIVRGSVPHLAQVIIWFGSPWVLGAITIGASALVTWAFWPKTPRRDERDDETDAGEDSPIEPETAGELVTAGAPAAPGADEPRTRRERRAAGMLAIALALGAGGALHAPEQAAAGESILTMTSDLDASGSYALDSDDPLYWHLDIDATGAPAAGELAVSMRASGSDALAMQVEVRACDVVWEAEGCPTGERMLRADAPLALDGATNPLLADPTPTVTHLRVALTAQAAPDVASAEASLTIRAIAGQTIIDESINGGELPRTGGQSWVFLAAPAAIIIGLGIALIVGARRRSK